MIEQIIWWGPWVMRESPPNNPSHTCSQSSGSGFITIWFRGNFYSSACFSSEQHQKTPLRFSNLFYWWTWCLEALSSQRSQMIALPHTAHPWKGPMNSTNSRPSALFAVYYRIKNPCGNEAHIIQMRHLNKNFEKCALRGMFGTLAKI